MTRHELIQEAYKVGVVRWDVAEELVDLICEAEREACVKICEKAWHESGGVIETVEFIEEIEARGNP